MYFGLTKFEEIWKILQPLKDIEKTHDLKGIILVTELLW